MNRVSVILPFYNSGSYLKESISSILTQTWEDFELLLLDDGSTDNSIDIVRGFQDYRIKYFREEFNKGIVYQLNKGIELSKGEFIARMDADDISQPDRFKKQLDFLDNSRNRYVDVLGSNALKFGEKNGYLDFQNYNPYQISFLLNFYCPILHPTVMMRSKIFDFGLRYSDLFKYAEDLALWKTIDNGRNIAILNEYLLFYRTHQNQTNAVGSRRELQKESTLKALTLKSKRKFDIDNFIIGNTFSTELWNDFDAKKRKLGVKKFYLYLRAKQLGIKSEMLYDLIK